MQISDLPIVAGVLGSAGALVTAMYKVLSSHSTDSHKASMDVVTMQGERLKEADARERDLKRQVDELEERVDDLEDNLRRHHGVIRDSRHDIGVVLERTDIPSDLMIALEKVHTRLDTRI